MGNILHDILTVSEFSKLANITEQHARLLIRQGKIPAKKVGKEYRLNKNDIYDYLNIKTDVGKVEEQMKIAKLESELKLYKSKFNIMQDMVNTLQNLIEIK